MRTDHSSDANETRTNCNFVFHICFSRTLKPTPDLSVKQRLSFFFLLLILHCENCVLSLCMRLCSRGILYVCENECKSVGRNIQARHIIIERHIPIPTDRKYIRINDYFVVSYSKHVSVLGETIIASSQQNISYLFYTHFLRIGSRQSRALLFFFFFKLPGITSHIAMRVNQTIYSIFTQYATCYMHLSWLNKWKTDSYLSIYRCCKET